jgi:transcriptional adapter 2-alpha
MVQHIDQDFDPTDPEPFQARKKARLEELQSRPIPLPPPKPLASAPTCHEIGGFMPGRLEFEHEWENEAEMLIKDMEFGRVYHFGGEDQPAAVDPPPTENVGSTADKQQAASGEAGQGEPEVEVVEPTPPVDEKPLPDGEKEGDEPEDELDLKLSILEMFNERYDKRMAAKDLIFDRGLINYKTVRSSSAFRSACLQRRADPCVCRCHCRCRLRRGNDPKKSAISSRGPRSLRGSRPVRTTKISSRAFSVSSGTQPDRFERGAALAHQLDSFADEITLRKRIAELQEYRRNGITTLAEADRYEQAKQQRLSFKASSYRESVSLSYDRAGAPGARRPTPQSTLIQQLKNRPAPPLTLATSQSRQLLTPLEMELCSTLRILPRPYLFLKEVLLREYVRLKDKMDGTEARKAVLREKNGEVFGPPDGAGGEWGEKIERVWEFLRDTVGLKEAQEAQEALDKEEDDDADADDDEGGPTIEEIVDEDGAGDVAMANGDALATQAVGTAA